MIRAAVAALVALAFFVVAGAGSAAVRVWFRQGPLLAPVERPVAGVGPALEALLAGPTRAERASGFRTVLPRGVVVRGITVRHRVVTIDLAALTVGSRDRRTIHDRVRQLVLTAGGVSGVRGVRVLVEGGTPLGIVPGLDLRRPLTIAAVASKPEQRVTTSRLQRQLADLGFMSEDGVTGEADERTQVATIAFQKWSGLERDGVLGPETVTRLLAAARPEPVRPAPGRRIEVLLDRQLALLEQDGKVLRAVHISTGRWGYTTPAGSFRVYRKERMSWSVPFEVWMPLASYFTGGIAFHQYPSVPVEPASHGCVRVTRFDAPLLYDFAAFGTPVEVLWRS